MTVSTQTGNPAATGDFPLMVPLRLLPPYIIFRASTDCRKCDELVNLMSVANYKFLEIELTTEFLAMQQPEIRNEIQSALALQDGAFPIVYLTTANRTLPVEAFSQYIVNMNRA